MKKLLSLPLFFFTFLLLTIGFDFVFPVFKIIHPYKWLGVILIIFGIVINLWADALYKQKGTTVKPHEKPTSLITSGPFRFMRNPMYLGMTAILFGVSVFSGSLIAFISPVIFIILIHTMVIPVEEKNLENVFGQMYLKYKSKTRRWI